MNTKISLVICAVIFAGCAPEEEVKPPVTSSAAVSAVSSVPAQTTVEKPVSKPTVPEHVAAKVAPAVPAVSSVPELKMEAVVVPATAETKPQAEVPAAEAIALAKKRNCFACHMVDKKVVGPAWKDIAAKYRGDAGAQARLEGKIAKGGSGVWGSMAMPAQPQLSAEERTLLTRFILNLK